MIRGTVVILRAVLVAGSLLGPAGLASAQKAKPPAKTPAQKAAQLYNSAMSALRTRQYAQAEGLLAKYVKSYSTHEYVPVGYLQLAACRWRLKDHEGHEDALEQVIRRFPHSPAWYIAYAAMLSRAKTAKDNDGYLTRLEAMVLQAGQGPWDLHTVLGRHYGEYQRNEYRGRDFWPVDDRPGGRLSKPGWVVDLLSMADTPERAERALRALAKNFNKLAKELPPDWQHVHVVLLRRAGQAELAEKAYQEYLESWGPDPRGMQLWLLKVAEARAAKNPEAIEAAYEALLEHYGSYGSLAEPFYRYLTWLYRRDKYERFTRRAREFLKRYRTSARWGYVVGYWVSMAQRAASRNDMGRIPSTLKMLEEFYQSKDPRLRRQGLLWQIDLLLRQGKEDEAVKLAGQLIEPDQWCAESLAVLSKYVGQHRAFQAVIDRARQQWKIPLPNPTSKAFLLLHQLKRRLKAEQARHAEEIGEEMFSKYRQDASTIEAVKLLAEYYFKKVLPEPRDKWMARMVQSYPRHPDTQTVLGWQIVAENAAKRYDRLALAIDTMEQRFGGAPRRWYYHRLSCYTAANDSAGALGYVKKVHGPLAAEGDARALIELSRYELSAIDGADCKAIGDYWVAKAKALAGTPSELFCLANALYGYYLTPYYQGYRQRAQWDEAMGVIQSLRKQKLDPELHWRLAFADVNLLARKGDGAAALKALEATLKDDQTYRDLSRRLDFAELGSALGKGNLVAKGEALAKRLRRRCFTTRDSGAIELMLGAMFYARKQYPAAAEHYLKVVKSWPFPARMYPFFRRALSAMQQARMRRFPGGFEAYLRRIGRVQELVPPLLYDAGRYYAAIRSSAALAMRKRLTSSYPASAAHDRMEEYFKKLRQQLRKNR